MNPKQIKNLLNSILFFLYRNETYFSPCKVRFLLSLFFHFYYLVGLHLFTELAVGLGDLLQSEKKVKASDVIIVEGALIFCSEELRNMFDLSLFIDTDDDVRLSRRVLKNE